jgi:thiol-disulfide isomerase/thioredoxin
MSPLLKSLLPILFLLSSHAHRPGWLIKHHHALNIPRGGSSAPATTQETELSLDDRVHAAMKRLGLDADVTVESTKEEETNGDGPACEGGVCTLPTHSDSKSTDADAPTTEASAEEPQDIESISAAIASEFDVPRDIVMAAIYSSFSGEGENMRIDESLARNIVQAEVDAISGVAEDCEEVSPSQLSNSSVVLICVPHHIYFFLQVKQLVSEGFDLFFSRRSLAYSNMNVDDARAILIADQEDEDAEQKEMAAKEEAPMKTVTVEYPKDFDPAAVAKPEPQQQQKPTPARKEDVVFEGTTADLQKLVIESPVPVLLDVYADWCGPCKQLTPLLEQICINAGGMLRLVKINTDQQRQISSALEVTSLPTVFGIRDGVSSTLHFGHYKCVTMSF